MRETWPACPGRAGRAPPDVDVRWLAAAFQSGEETPSETLLAIVRQLRGLPAWTLTAVWLLECALAWPDAPCSGRQGGLLGELGDLYCQTGDIVQGVKLLDDAQALLGRDDPESWTCALRAARWIAVPNPVAAVGRLAQLAGDEAAPAAVRLMAELELLGHEREPRPTPTL